MAAPERDVGGSEILLEFDLTPGELVSFLLEYEANKLGLRAQRLTPTIVILKDDRSETIMQRACARGISHAAFEITADKSLTKLIFNQAGIPHSPYVKLRPFELDRALEFARACDFHVVIKPTHGSRGKRVFTQISDEGSFCSSWSRLSKKLKGSRQQVLVEERFTGTDFRFFVVDCKVECVLERSPACVTGDGISTIHELVAGKNGMRSKNPDLRGRLIEIDGTVLETLRVQGLYPNGVPPAGMTVALRNNANVSTGGDSIDRTDDIPAPIKDLVIRAVSAVPDLHNCGVDVMAKNIYNATRLGPKDIIFNELEGDAAMSMHHFPGFGKPRNLARAILLAQFRHSQCGLPTSDYRHDFDENVQLCRKIIEEITALQLEGTPTRRPRGAGWLLDRLGAVWR